MKRDKFANEKQQYAMWLGLPPDVRQPKTQQEFAEKIGVAPETLSRWGALSDVKNIAENAVKLLGGGDLYEITQTLIEKAKSADVRAIELYLKWQGELKQEKTEGKPIGTINLNIRTDKKP